jgi:hypothetical protein
MSRRANILLVLALAAGIAYGYFGVPFLLPLVADDVEATVEEPNGQRISDLDETRFRLQRLRPGMTGKEVAKVLDLPYNPHPYSIGSRCWNSFNYGIDQSHYLHLDFGPTGLVTAELRVW